MPMYVGESGKTFLSFIFLFPIIYLIFFASHTFCLAPSETRGFLVTCINVALTGGQFFSSCVDGFFSTVPNGWRYMLGFAAIPAFLQLIGKNFV